MSVSMSVTMADADENAKPVNESVLVAFVTVHLESGESFDLLPFEDTSDVKSKVSDLMKDWAKSGFLIRGNEIYPWHRVRRIEATRVEEMSPEDSKLRRQEWEAKDTARLQQSFWMTKQPRQDKEEGAEEKGGKGEEQSAGKSGEHGKPPRMAA